MLKSYLSSCTGRNDSCNFTLESSTRYDIHVCLLCTFLVTEMIVGQVICFEKSQGILKSDVCGNYGRKILDFYSSCFNFPGHGSESESQSDNQEKSERNESRDGTRTEGQETTREGTEDW